MKPFELPYEFCTRDTFLAACEKRDVSVINSVWGREFKVTYIYMEEAEGFYVEYRAEDALAYYPAS